MDPVQRPPVSRPLSLSFVVLFALLLAGYVWFLRSYTSPYAGGSDSSGYLNSAALLKAGLLRTPVPGLPGHGAVEFGLGAHVPLGFTIRAGTDLMAPSYPIGLPLHLVAFSWPVGLDWATVPLNICSALAGGLLLYLLARRLELPPGIALFGAGLLLLCPLYLFSALQPMSDLLALVWLQAALYAALRVREGRGWAVFCGLATALAVLVRPTNVLLALPLLLALGPAWRSYLWVGLGGLPGALLLGWYNSRVYGAPFTTGYGEVWSAFSREYAGHNLGHFARWIPVLLTPLVLAALAAPFQPALRRREFLVLGSWAAVLIGFYAFYYHSGETWWYLRFILPAFPALILIALAALHSLTARARRRTAIWGLLVAAGLAWETVLLGRLELVRIKPGEATYPESAAWARAHLPADAVVFCMQVSGALHYYTDFLLVRWDQTTEMPRLLRALEAEHRPVYAVLYAFEEPQVRERLGGRWTRLGQVHQATIWRIDLALAQP